MKLRIRVQRALKKCPPLFHSARAVLNASRTVFGPGRLKRQIDRQVAGGGPLRIVIGSSQVFEDGWIPTNVQYLNVLMDEHWHRAFGTHPIDAILAEHVWEHLTLEEAKVGAAKCYQFLRPGGRLRIAVPDGFHPDPDYIEFVRPGGSGSGAWDHKVLFNHKTLSDVFASAGFNVHLLEYYDEQGKFHGSSWDQSDGRVWRCKGFKEPRGNGTDMDYSSLIVDGIKPA